MSLTVRPFVAYFTREQDVLGATGAMRTAGLAIRDDFTPHGLQGLGAPAGFCRSRLGPVCLFAGLTGLTTMLFWACWTSTASDFVPGIAPMPFEFSVLSAALVTVSALFGVARFWPGRAADTLQPVCNDRFARVLDPTDDQQARALPLEHGAVETGRLDARTQRG